MDRLVGWSVTMSQITCHGLSKYFGEVHALEGVSCEVPSGGALLVLGPSGAGKSTFLRIIAGLARPDEGTVRIGDELVSGPNVMTPPHRRGVAFVFQRPTLWPHMNALDNVALALVGAGRRRKERRTRAAEALARLGMSDRGKNYPATLSGGELQRVSLARALVTEPRVLLLDEPFAALDVHLRKDLLKTLGALKYEQGVTMLWVSHRIEEALSLADSVLLLRGGVAEESGKVQEIINKPDSPFREFLMADHGHRCSICGNPENASGQSGEEKTCDLHV